MIYFIVNPKAGNGKAKVAIPVIERIMNGHNAEYSFIYTESPGDLERVSGLIDFDIAKTVICVGGDGTIQEYVSLVINKNINFGVIPAGSGNDLILSIPMTMPENAKKFSDFEKKIIFYTEKIIKQEIIHVDAVSVNGENYFFNIGGTGIDIQVLKDALPLKKFMGGGAYFISLIKNVFTYKPMEMTMTVDGESETGKYVLLAICNGAYYGGNMRICPPAIINDGYMTLCKIKKMPKFKVIAMFPKVKSGKHSKLKEVSFVNCSSLKLEFDGKKIINLDGNLVEFESPMTFEIIKDAVRFII
ncbi:MAG: diacylglycerol kinase family lipid kinase [Oscillospiraceae bacterium]|nr:diacylglycerol kinase family lipid kinase [Oscillospiraceae bacterium]